MDIPAIASNALARRIARYPLRILPRGIALPILSGPLRGKKWIVGSFLHECWLGTYESDFQNRLVKEIKIGTVFYDIGANVGFYSLLAAKLVGSGSVYAFEPLPANVKYLRKHLQLNGIDNVKPIEMAISDSCGPVSFVTEQSRGMGRLEPGGDLSVEGSTLDALIRDERIAPPNYIKMDIEGAEFHALLGARQCFEHHKPVLFLATHGRDIHKKCFELLQSWDYEIETIRQSEADRAEIVSHPRSSSEC